MKEKIYRKVWRLGARIYSLGKHNKLQENFEPYILKWAPLFIPPPSKEVEITLPFGMRIIVPAGWPAARTYGIGLYEKEVTNLFKKLVKKGMIIVDVGGGVGYYSLLASHLVGDSGQVYVFEPHPIHYNYLIRNIRINNATNVMAIRKGISNKTGLTYLNSNKLTSQSRVSPLASSSSSLKIQTITLDEFFLTEGWPSVDLVKMDIEGGEKSALERMDKLSSKNPQMRLIMEWDVDYIHRSGATPNVLINTLLYLGFKNAFIIEKGLKPIALDKTIPKIKGWYNLLVTKY